MGARLGEFVEGLAPRVRDVVGVLFPIPLNPRPTAVRGFGSIIVGAGALSKAPDRNLIKEYCLPEKTFTYSSRPRPH